VRPCERECKRRHTGKAVTEIRAAALKRRPKGPSAPPGPNRDESASCALPWARSGTDGRGLESGAKPSADMLGRSVGPRIPAAAAVRRFTSGRVCWAAGAGGPAKPAEQAAEASSTPGKAQQSASASPDATRTAVLAAMSHEQPPVAVGAAGGGAPAASPNAGALAARGSDTLLQGLRELDADKGWRWNAVAAAVGAVFAGAWAFQAGYWAGQEDSKIALRAKLARYAAAVRTPRHDAQRAPRLITRPARDRAVSASAWGAAEPGAATPKPPSRRVGTGRPRRARRCAVAACLRSGGPALGRLGRPGQRAGSTCRRAEATVFAPPRPLTPFFAPAAQGRASRAQPRPPGVRHGPHA